MKKNIIQNIIGIKETMDDDYYDRTRGREDYDDDDDDDYYNRRRRGGIRGGGFFGDLFNFD